MYRVLAVPLFADNYSYIIRTLNIKGLILVDPANPDILLDAAKKIFPNAKINHVLYTHKHWDHAGGADKLREALQGSEFNSYIGQLDHPHIPAVITPVKHEQQFQMNEAIARVYSVPCHTRGHVIYHFMKSQEKVEPLPPLNPEILVTSQGKIIHQFDCAECLFTGDTLFSGGVGRFFQGEAKQMVSNLEYLEKNVSSDCPIFNGHEYTLSNLKWSSQVEPDNQFLQKYFKEIQTKVCTLPTTLKLQSEINLFYRVITGTPLAKYAKDKVDLMNIFREMKNNGITTFQKGNL